MSHGLDIRNQQVELQPILAELFRTCIHPPVLLLRVEHVERHHTGRELNESHTSRDRDDAYAKARNTRYFLTDGKLLVQALLHRKINSLLGSRDVLPGDFIEIYKFDVKKARRNNGGGHVVYLAIKDCQLIPVATRASRDSSDTVISEARKPKTVTKKKQRSTERLNDQDEDVMAGGFFKEGDRADTQAISKKRKIDQITTTLAGSEILTNATGLADNRELVDAHAKGTMTRQVQLMTKPMYLQHLTPLKTSSTGPFLDVESDDEDAFETISLDENTARKRRRALHELSQTTVSSIDHRLAPKVSSLSRDSSSRSALLEIMRTDDIQNVNERSQMSSKDVPTSGQPARPLSAHQSTTPQDEQFLQAPDPEPPFHNLHSILHPPASAPLPRKNYTFTTLAIITYIGPSLISKPNTPFPPKRHIKIEDLSLHKDQISNKFNSKNLANELNHTPSSFPDKRGKGITVAIYQDAATFKPNFGTLALFRGLVMQRLSNGDVVLNVYPKSRKIVHLVRSHEEKGGTSKAEVLGVEDKSVLPRSVIDHGDGDSLEELRSDDIAFREGEWFITDQTRLKRIGYDVDGLATWWNERAKELKLSK